MKSSSLANSPATTIFRALVALTACLLPTAAHTEPVDPSLPVVVAIGVPDSPAPAERANLQRTSQIKTRLPVRPIETGRRAVGALAQPPIPHADGSLSIALQSPEVVHLAADGSELGRARLGPSPAVRPPVLLPNGGLAVFTAAPSIVFLSSTFKVSATVALPKAAFAAQPSSFDSFEGASILASPDGAVFVAANRSIMEVDASGRVLTKFTIPERIASDLLPHPRGLIVVGDLGTVYLLRAPAEPRVLGSLGSMFPGTATLLDDRALVAFAPPNRIVSFDLKSTTLVTRVGDNPFAFFDGIPAYDSKGNTWVTSTEGFLVSFDPAGVELTRSPADRDATMTQPFGFRPHNRSGIRTQILVDREDRIAFLRGGGRFGVRSPDGTTNIGVDRSCLTPIGLVPISDGQVVLACREGTLIFFADQAASTTP